MQSMLKNTFVSLLIFLFVLMFVNRIFSYYKKQHIFPLKMMTNFGTFYFVLLIVVYFFKFQSPLWLCFFSFSMMFLLPFLVFVFARFQQQQFYSEFLRFLSMVILSMQRGMSFSTAMEVSIRSRAWKQDQLLTRIYENVVFSQQEPVAKRGLFAQFLSEIHVELHAIYNHQHQALDRLCNFRKNIRERLNFRQKSRQIWLYFAYQLGLLSLIYLSILVYIVIEFGFFQFQKSFLRSFVFYSFGFLFTLVLARGKKWSI